MGRDKATLDLAGTTLLDRTLAGVPAEVEVVAVGPRVPVARDVAFCSEEPPGGGPVAAVDAGIALVHSPVVVLLATDLPLVGTLPSVLASRLEAASADVDAVITIDGRQRMQQLCSAYRTQALQDAITAGGAAAGAAMRDVVERLRVITADVSDLGADQLAVHDVDTPEDLALVEADVTEADHPQMRS